MVNHLHLLLRAECERSPGPGDEQKIYFRVIKLIHEIGMEIFMEPKVKYMPDLGNEGLTYIAGLETSHTSGHFWDKPDQSIMKYPGSTLLQADLYTCGLMTESEIKTILSFINEYNPKLVNVAIFDRSRHDTFFEPLIKINYNYKTKGNYLKFISNLSIDYTNRYKKKFLSVA